MWAVVFASIGWWALVVLDFAIVASGLVTYMMVERGHLAAGLLVGQGVLIAIAIIMGLLIDVPTADAPRVSHLYLLVIATLGYLNYQRLKSRAQLIMIGVCLLAFVALASAPLTSPLVVMPEFLRMSGTWANSIIATAMLAACIHVMHAEFIRKDTLSRDLMTALWNEAFQLVYQPQVDLSRKTIGAEALIRWNSPQRGLVSPADFIPQAEKLGHMIAIGGWVFERSCRTLTKWGKEPHLRHLTMSINVSASQLMHEGFETLVHDTLVSTKANPRQLIIELTEDVLVSDIELVITKLQKLRQLGITFSLDDFGTGYSSLSYLRRLPVQQIKIDRSFVQDVAVNSSGASLANNIVLMGRDLGYDVLAEGVETTDQHNLFAQFGCTQFQGCLYSRPVALADFEKHITAEA